MTFTSCWKKFELDLDNSALHELGSYEKWVDLSQHLKRDLSSLRHAYYVINPAGKNILIHREDKGNILNLDYHYTPEEKEEAGKTLNDLLSKLHPDTRKSIKILN